MKIKFELDLETAQELKKKLTFKINPTWIKLRNALKEQKEVCLSCGQKIRRKKLSQ